MPTRHPIAWTLLLALVCCVLLPGNAWAAGAGLSTETFQAILILLGVVSVAYIVTHVASEWISERLGIVTGVEYIILGAIVGPGFGLFDTQTLTQLSPAIVLGTGSLGLLTGLQLEVRRMGARTLTAFTIAVVVSLVTFIAVSGLPLLALAYFDVIDSVRYYAPHLLCVGAVAVVASIGPLRSLIAFLDARGPGTDLALRVARACSSIGIIIFGLIFCLYKPAGELLNWAPASSALGSFIVWFVIHLLLGGVLGLIFTAFLIRDFEDEKILTVVIGMVIFTSGLAYYLKLSPIFVNFVLGMVLANMCRQSGHVESMLTSVERPLYIVLFFFAGAALTFGIAPWAYALFVPYLILRLFGRFVGGVLAGRLTPTARQLPPMGAALWAPGALSVAMALNFKDVYGDLTFAAEIYVALVIAIVISEAVAYRKGRRWLIDATDVALAREERGDAPPDDLHREAP